MSAAASPRVLVAMPSRGYPWAPSLLQAERLAVRLGTPFCLELGSPVHHVRTRIARRFLESDCTHLFTIDDDIVLPEGALERLLALECPLAAGVYPLALQGGIVASVKREGDARWPDRVPREVFPVVETGLGCALIARVVFERTAQPWFLMSASPSGELFGEDVWFSRRVRGAGLEMRCDGSVVCHHMKGDVDLLALSGWTTA
jgi:hypothetical protein